MRNQRLQEEQLQSQNLRQDVELGSIERELRIDAPRRVVGKPAMKAAVSEIGEESWSAVGDPNRRRMFDVLPAGGGGTAPLGATTCRVDRKAVTTHLGVLGRVRRVHAVAAGHERHQGTSDAQCAPALTQPDATGSVWDSRLARTRRIAETIQRSQQQ